MKPSTSRYVKERAKQLRKTPTPAEALLWERLRRKGLRGYKFYRQYPIGRYIADFCCPEIKLIIELDGEIHDTERSKVCDEMRDKTLFYEGMLVVRFQNEQVLFDIDNVLDTIKKTINSNFPLPQDGGGDGERA